MTELRTEEEQVEAIKKWWRENGLSTMLALVLGLGAYFGWNYWQTQQQQQLETASFLYNKLVQVVAVNQGQEASAAAKDEMNTLANELKNDFAKTTYGDFGALFAARFAADEGNYEQAAVELNQLLNSTKKDAIKHVAQARLAQLYVQQDKLAEAIALVEKSPSAAFLPQFAEVRGDALYRQGNVAEAVKAYQEAQVAAQAQGMNGQLLQRKIDSLTTTLAGDI